MKRAKETQYFLCENTLISLATWVRIIYHQQVLWKTIHECILFGNLGTSSSLFLFCLLFFLLPVNKDCYIKTVDWRRVSRLSNLFCFLLPVNKDGYIRTVDWRRVSKLSNLFFLLPVNKDGYIRTVHRRQRKQNEKNGKEIRRRK